MHIMTTITLIERVFLLKVKVKVKIVSFCSKGSSDRNERTVRGMVQCPWCHKFVTPKKDSPSCYPVSFTSNLLIFPGALPWSLPK